MSGIDLSDDSSETERDDAENKGTDGADRGATAPSQTESEHAPETPVVDTSPTYWNRALVLFGAGLLLVGLQQIYVLGGYELVWVGQIAVVSGVAGIGAGTYYFVESFQATVRNQEQETRELIRKLRGDLHSNEYEEVIRHIREQRSLVEQLLSELPDQQAQMMQLEEQLDKQDEKIRQMIEQDIEARRKEIESLEKAKDQL